jgi:hypothetical protein
MTQIWRPNTEKGQLDFDFHILNEIKTEKWYLFSKNASNDQKHIFEAFTKIEPMTFCDRHIFYQ